MKKVYYQKYKIDLINSSLSSKDFILFFNIFHWSITLQNQVLAHLIQSRGWFTYCSRKQFNIFNGSLLLIVIEKNLILKFIKQFPYLKKNLIGLKVGKHIYSKNYLNKFIGLENKPVQIRLIQRFKQSTRAILQTFKGTSVILVNQLQIKQIKLYCILKSKRS